MNSPDKQSRNSKTSPSNHKSKKAIKSNSKSPSKLTKSPKKFQTPPKEFHPVPKIKKVPNEINKFSYIYSPRTTFSLQKEDEERLFNDLAIGFDPITIKIIKTQRESTRARGRRMGRTTHRQDSPKWPPPQCLILAIRRHRRRSWTRRRWRESRAQR